MATIAGEYRVCDCCALMIANGDESGCRDYYDHGHRTCTLPGPAAIAGDEYTSRGGFLCDGCDAWQGAMANVWPVVVFD